MRGDGTQYEAVARARAIGNAVVYVTSIYAPLGSLIMDPFGKVLARTPRDNMKPCLAAAEVPVPKELFAGIPAWIRKLQLVPG